MTESTAGQPGEMKASQRILVVDDNELLARALGKVLVMAGFEADVFHRASTALDHAGRNAPPAAAVLDVHLPDLSGLVLSGKLRECYGPGVPILVLSGDTSMETLNSLTLVGATYFLSKPVNPNLLIERLKELTAA